MIQKIEFIIKVYKDLTKIDSNENALTSIIRLGHFVYAQELNVAS